MKSTCAFILVALVGCATSPPTSSFSGEVSEGEPYSRAFGDEFIFNLQPIEHGWLIRILNERKTEDLSRFTPPLHLVPNPRFVEGWHFRNADNTGPNVAGEKNVNAPQEVRRFVFSPEVGRTIAGPGATTQPSTEEIRRIAEYGQGTLTITDYALGNLVRGERAKFESMKFNVELIWQPNPE